MARAVIRSIGALCLTGALLATLAGTANAATINVTTVADEYGAGSGCGLREAVQAANSDAPFGGCRAGGGDDEIVLQQGGIYGRSLAGIAEDANATGDIDIASPVSIGPRRGKATIDADGLDRVLHVLPAGDLSLSRVTVTGASETYPPPPAVDGAGILNQGRLELSRSRITGNETLGNSANNGGGLTTSGIAILDRTRIVGNRADNVGGGISMYGGTLKVRRSTVSGNESGYLGGGLYVGGSPSALETVRITDSTIAGNRSDGNGGGVYVDTYGDDDGNRDGATLTNVTLSGNRSDESGGGLYHSTGTASLRSSTVTGNVADDDGSGGDGHGGGLAGGSIAFVNSIVSGNADNNPVDPQPDCSGASSQGRSVVGSFADCGKGKKDRRGDPKLRPLGMNGGPTATHALKRASPAIGRANARSPKRDQRGVKRDRDPDSGAYERR